jgi:hypothetical protein
MFEKNLLVPEIVLEHAYSKHFIALLYHLNIELMAFVSSVLLADTKSVSGGDQHRLSEAHHPSCKFTL